MEGGASLERYSYSLYKNVIGFKLMARIYAKEIKFKKYFIDNEVIFQMIYPNPLNAI